MSKEISPTKVAGKRKLALLLPAHNEELIIKHTIESALANGLTLEDVYVVDDNSGDTTRKRALEVLSESNVLTVERSGKAKAIAQAIDHFNLKDRYEWMHVSDADSIFGKDYFNYFKEALSDKYVVAIGYVQSMPGNWISKYRLYQYTYGQTVMRRIQAWFRMISVLPGPTTCFRTDILDDLDFLTDSLTEDFDITLQIHRKKLGRMKFIPEAINYTQDPRTIQDFRKQYLRWVRGFFQSAKKHHIGLGMQRIDFYLSYQIVETFLNVIQTFFIYPFIIYVAHDGYLLARLMLGDVALFLSLTIYAAAITNRPNTIYAFPLFYILRTLETILFIQAFVEIIILGKYSQKQVGWETGSRRYAVKKEVLQEVET